MNIQVWLKKSSGKHISSITVSKERDSSEESLVLNNVKSDIEIADDLILGKLDYLRSLNSLSPITVCCYINKISVTLEKLIQTVLESIYEYGSFFTGKKTICDQFKNSPLTAQKKTILDDFGTYCIWHANKDIDKVMLATDWLNSYRKAHDGQNPFDILRQHRRTGLLSFFNPEQTNSIKLFHSFLKGQTLTPELMSAINGTIENDQPVP